MNINSYCVFVSLVLINIQTIKTYTKVEKKRKGWLSQPILFEELTDGKSVECIHGSIVVASDKFRQSLDVEVGLVGVFADGSSDSVERSGEEAREPFGSIAWLYQRVNFRGGDREAMLDVCEVGACFRVSEDALQFAEKFLFCHVFFIAETD